MWIFIFKLASLSTLIFGRFFFKKKKKRLFRIVVEFGKKKKRLLERNDKGQGKCLESWLNLEKNDGWKEIIKKN